MSQRSTISRWRLLLAVVAVFALFATACGDDDSADSPEGYDPDGVIRVTADLSVDAGILWDPIAMRTGQSINSYPVQGGWLKRDNQGVFNPDLAEKVTVLDDTTIEVTLREDLEFSNGETLDAQVAKDSIDRNIASENSAGLRTAELALISSVDVVSSTVFTITLSEPSIALFYPLMADAETAPVAPESMTANDNTSAIVIGAGPFKIDSYDAGVKAVLSKNEKYYDADNVLLAGIEYIHSESPTSTDTALRSGAVDYATVTIAQAGQYSDPVVVDYDRKAAPFWLNMCAKADNALGDLKVRQALNHAVNRQAINDLTFAGRSEPAWALAPSDSPLGTPALDDYYPHDVEKAKTLLAEAGYGPDNPLKLVLVYTANNEGEATILQSQFAEAGIELELKITQNILEDWYLNPTGDMNMVPMIREGVSRLTRLVTSTAFANVCKFPKPEFDPIAAELVKTDPSDPKALELWDQANTVFVENADGVPLVYFLSAYATNGDTVGELPTMTDSIMTQRPDFSRVWMKKG